MIYRYHSVVLFFPQVYYLCFIATLLHNKLPQDDPYLYPECHFVLMHLHHSLYLSTGGNLGFFRIF